MSPWAECVYETYRRMQNFSHCVSNGHLRGKPLLVERLQSIAAALWPGRPQLVLKHVLPATFSLLQVGLNKY